MSELGTDGRDGDGAAGWGRDAGRGGGRSWAGVAGWLVLTVPLAAVVSVLCGALVLPLTCFGDTEAPWLAISGLFWLVLAGGPAVRGLRYRRVPWWTPAVLALLTVPLYLAVLASGPLPSDDCYGNVW
ncbi:hypothetical protein [Kitasatospora sp. NPDC004289]